MIPAFLLSAFAISTLAAVASAAPLQTRAPASVVDYCSVSGTVALTFDDGPYLYEQDVLSTLGDSKATFFFTGSNYACIYDHAQLVRDIHAAGHTIGSHSWSHPDFTTLSYDETHDQLYKVEQAFAKILGLKPKYFRAPYGSYNDLTLQVLGERGYTKLILWSEDSGDSQGLSTSQIIDTFGPIISSYPAAHNVLLHSVYENTVNEVLPNVVPRLVAAGYALVAVDTCLGAEGEYPYVYVGEPQAQDASWTC